MALDRGHTLLTSIAIGLAAACLGAAIWAASTGGAHRPEEAAGMVGDDLVYDFTGRSVSAAGPWRVEGAADRVQHTARGLLIVARTADDPPRLVLELNAPEESFSALEVTMALNKGASGRVWGSRYAGERPPENRCRSFLLEPGVGVRTYRVDLGAGTSQGAPFHSLNIQLTDAPVRAVVRKVRLLRTAGWRSFVNCSSGLPSTVVIGGIGGLAQPAPETGSLSVQVNLPADRPRLHLATAIHPMQKLLGRPEVGFRVRLRPLDGPNSLNEPLEDVFQRLVNPADHEQRRWFFDEVDLSPWAGRLVQLNLNAWTWRRENDGPEQLLPGRPPWALPLWGPVMISGGGVKPTPPPAGIVLVLIDGVGQNEFGCYGNPGGFPAVGRHFGGAAHLREAYIVEYGRDGFLHSLLRADYLPPSVVPGASVPGLNLVQFLHTGGIRTAAFYSGGAAEELLRDGSLQPGFELIGRSEFELGLPPTVGFEWSESNPLFALPGPLSWVRQLGDEPFFMLVHLDAGGSKSSSREDRLAAIDRAVGRLAALFSANGRLDHTVFCLAGLHGPVREARVDRGCRLWDESALVPLLIRAPGGLPGVPGRNGIFRSIDILPTLFDLAGPEWENGNLPSLCDRAEPVSVWETGGTAGTSLAPWLRGEEAGAWPVEEVFLHQRRVGRRYLGLRRGPIKLIWRVEPRDRAACYDLDADPEERTDISPAGPFSLPLHVAEPLGTERYTDLVHRLETHFSPR